MVYTRRDVVFNEQDFGHIKEVTRPPESIEVQTEVSKQQPADPEQQEPEGRIRRSERSRHPPVRYGLDKYSAAVSVQHITSEHE